MADRLDELGSRGDPWTDTEVDMAVAGYVDMLRREISGETYTKRSVVRTLESVMPDRSPRAIESKFQNISAIMEELDLPWIDGYKPLRHYQGSLREAVVRAVRPNHLLREGVAAYEASPLVAPSPRRLSIEDVLVETPTAGPSRLSRKSSVAITGGDQAALRDFQTRRLGTAGERWVLEIERETLRRAGRTDLADAVRWVARDDGDGYGYDIASYRRDGSGRLIEVKTTNFGARTPFYITRWELEVSKNRSDEYSLYRVHGFARDPRIYVLDGDIADQARLDPKVFLGVPL